MVHTLVLLFTIFLQDDGWEADLFKYQKGRLETGVRLHIIDPRKLVIPKPVLEKLSCLRLNYHKL